jgi:transposase-like protein
MTKQASPKYASEVRERAVRMVFEHEGEHVSQWAAISSIAAKIGCNPETLRGWVRQAERDRGKRTSPTSDDRERIKALEREVREQHLSERDPSQGIGVFRSGGSRPPVQEMIAFIDEHRAVHGVEPICTVLPIAPSTYHDHIAKRADPSKTSARWLSDAELSVAIQRIWNENFQVYGVRKVWRQLRREGFDVARCTVARLMRRMGLKGATRGKAVRTTVSNRAAPCPLDRVNRQFQAPRPNALWVADFTFVATWQGFVYVVFVIDTFARRTVAGGYRAPHTPALSWMPWSRRFMIAGQPRVAASSTIPSAGRNKSRSSTPNV